MSILTDVDIKKAIKSRRLVIEPFDESMVQPGSIDFNLGNQFRFFKYDRNTVIDWKEGGMETETVEVKDEEHVLLQPRELVLGVTREKIKLPSDMIGWIEGRSSLARLGLMIHVTAGFIHPGSSGRQTLEIANMANVPIKLYPGMPICQIVLEDTISPAKVPYNRKKGARYVNQSGPDAYMAVKNEILPKKHKKPENKRKG